MATITLNNEMKLEVVGTHTGKISKPIYDITTKTAYASLTDAAEAIGGNVGDISKHLQGKGKKVKGHRFCFVKDIPAHIHEITAATKQETKPSPYETIIQNKRYLLNCGEYISAHKAEQQKLEAKLAAKKEEIRKEIIKRFELTAQTAIDEYELIRNDTIDPCLLTGEELIEAMRTRGIKYNIRECDEYRALKGE